MRLAPSALSPFLPAPQRESRQSPAGRSCQAAGGVTRNDCVARRVGGQGPCGLEGQAGAPWVEEGEGEPLCRGRLGKSLAALSSVAQGHTVPSRRAEVRGVALDPV